jgi:hypothetical protein
MWTSGILASVVTLCLVAQNLSARPARLWSESELFDEADLVVLIKATGTKDVPAPSTQPAKPETWVEVSTTFDVQAMMKGKLGSKPLVVRHHRYRNPEGENNVPNGPLFVQFSSTNPRQYLAFLKEVQVGDQIHYEPLTGQWDPDRSFFLVEPYHVTREPRATNEEKTQPGKPTGKDSATNK